MAGRRVLGAFLPHFARLPYLRIRTLELNRGTYPRLSVPLKVGMIQTPTSNPPLPSPQEQRSKKPCLLLIPQA
ncbi:hypothetical protein LZ31DRAFT_560710, partial [Colletotrichum somersetense]